MKEEYFTTLQGKRFILYKGLLALSHEKGIKSIEEEIVQIPGPNNGEMAVVKATITDADGNIWTGIGDANPDNVNRNIAKHVLRMASTRAKARAMRDMCNIGEAALEELGGDDAPAPPPVSGATLLAGEEQIREIRALAQDYVKDGVKGLETALGHPLAAMSPKRADEILKQLQARKGKVESGPKA